jgi:poly(A) polymerase/tRNA nucleotidyltransferase (CCA-adding enzyme)
VGEPAGLSAVWDALPEARLVGGAVRDRLAGLAVADIDLAVPLAPEVVMRRLQAAGVKVVPTGLAHGTVTAVSEGVAFEVTSLRRDVRTDGRWAEVEFVDAWEEDAARRDFTINAMSAARDGTLFDYFGGRDDLGAGRVRFVGEAARRVAEDYLRIFRFFRFFARYGRGAADEEALAAIAGGREGVAGLSVERVWAELKRILQAPSPVEAVVLMEATGVLGMVGAGASVERLAALAAAGAPADPLLRVAALFGARSEALAGRMRASAAEGERLAALVRGVTLTPAADAAAIRQALADEEADIVIGRTWLGGEPTGEWEDLRRRIAAARKPVFPLQGRDLAALGMAPGPAMGRVLQRVRDWWWAGGCVADRAACLARARSDGDAHPELDDAVGRDAEELGGGDGVAGHKQEGPAADEA